MASAGAALLNAGVKERVGPFRQTALALAREQGDETALVLLEMELMVDRVVEEGLTEPVLAYAHEVDARARAIGSDFAAVNTALVPIQFLVLAGRIDEARSFAANVRAHLARRAPGGPRGDDAG